LHESLSSRTPSDGGNGLCFLESLAQDFPSPKEIVGRRRKKIRSSVCGSLSAARNRSSFCLTRETLDRYDLKNFPDTII
jgi:hypothetical protein